MKSRSLHRPNFIFVVGGVMSSVGKGVTTASIGAILKSYGYSVTLVKADPYVNVDAGTMNPTEHGEVFVTVDGDETDQDIGNYERFTHQEIPSINYMTTGRVYLSVIERERNLKFHGKCVEVVPHIPQEMIRRIKAAQAKSKADFTLIEIGGTVGEYQNILFLEAARMMKLERPDHVRFILVSYLPIPTTVGEMKTKPTQYASRTLNSVGIQADFIVCRGPTILDAPRRERLANLCGIPRHHAISAPDLASAYQVPVAFEKESFGKKILASFGLKPVSTDLREWRSLNRTMTRLTKKVRIGMIGKYFDSGDFTLADAYISVIEAAKHAGWAEKRQVEFRWLSAEAYEKNPALLKQLSEFDGCIVPGGFGSRGIEGLILAIQFLRERRIPYFGLCYGMQLACVEFARHVLGLKKAHTIEVDPHTPDPVITVNPHQKENIKHRRYGGSMRLGAYPCSLKLGTISRSAYRKETVQERHRHRYEFNNAYLSTFEENGMKVAGTYAKNGLVEIVELDRKDHPFFVGTQFHPEFTSRPLVSHPLFLAFMKAALAKGASKKKASSVVVRT